MSVKRVRHESEAGEALDLISLREVASFGMFFHMMQPIHFIHDCLR